MPEISRILCPVDFSEFSARAFRYAISLARHYHARLFVQHVVELWRYPSAAFAASGGLYEEFIRAMREKAEEQLQEFVKTARGQEIQPELVVEEGLAPDLIMAFAAAQAVNLLVMGTHGRRGFDRLMLGSVTERVVREGSCSVLAVRQPEHDFLSSAEGDDSVHLKRILYCTDFSENSRRALGRALSVREEYNAELTLLHVLEDTFISANKEEAEAAAARQLAKMIPTTAGEGGKMQTAVRVGKPYEQIIRLASGMQTDLVVMAVRGRSAIDLAIFGSTTYRVLQLGPCPVLVVHA